MKNEAEDAPMAELDTIRKELETLLKEVKNLQAEVAKPASPEADAAAGPAPADTPAEDASDAIAELQKYLTSKAGEAEDVLEDHPLVALAAAFVLGLAAGAIAFR